MTSPIIDAASERPFDTRNGPQDAGPDGESRIQVDAPEPIRRPAEFVDERGHRLSAGRVHRGPGGWESRSRHRDGRTISWQQALAGGALLGTGALLLWRSRQHAASHHYEVGFRESLRSLRHGARESWDGARERASGLARDVRDGAQEASETLSSRVGSLADATRERAHSIGDKAQQRYDESSDYLAQQYGEMQSRVETLLHEQPLVVGAIGVAVGAAIGGLMPSTRREDQLLGGIRDDVVSQASRAAVDKVDTLGGQAADALSSLGERAFGSDETDKDSADRHAQGK